MLSLCSKTFISIDVFLYYFLEVLKGKGCVIGDGKKTVRLTGLLFMLRALGLMMMIMIMMMVIQKLIHCQGKYFTKFALRYQGVIKNVNDLY